MSKFSPKFVETPPDQIIHEIASPLIAVRNGQEEFISGTAFVVGRGFAVTAYHVLSDFLMKYEGIQDVENNLNVSFNLLMFFTVNQGKEHIPVRVLKVWRSEPLDLAVLAFNIPNETHVWAVPQLNLLPPKVGEPIIAFGFADSMVGRPDEDASPVANLYPRTATGIVSEVHHISRDSSRMPFPCFRTNARFDGGMSGGPIFNSQGSLCGAVCSNMPPIEAGQEHISYGCSLWPIIGTLIDVGETTFSTGSYYPFLELFKRGVVSATDLNNVSIDIGPGGTRSPGAHYDATLWTYESSNKPPS